MTRTLLLDSSGNRLVVKQGASCDITITLTDTGGSTTIKSALVTLTATLKNAKDGTTINSRASQTILDANGGSVTSGGVVTLMLDAADNTIVGSSVRHEETHNLDVDWTYTDSSGNTRIGQARYKFYVQPDDVSNSTSEGWFG